MVDGAGVGIELLAERLQDRAAGVLSCWDRMLISGTLPNLCYAEGMSSFRGQAPSASGGDLRHRGRPDQAHDGTLSLKRR